MGSIETFIIIWAQAMDIYCAILAHAKGAGETTKYRGRTCTSQLEFVFDDTTMPTYTKKCCVAS